MKLTMKISAITVVVVEPAFGSRNAQTMEFEANDMMIEGEVPFEEVIGVAKVNAKTLRAVGRGIKDIVMRYSKDAIDAINKKKQGLPRGSLGDD